MPLIDDRGRLFGKVNLIDAVFAFVALRLIPLAYGAFLLFRVPEPSITSISPTQVTENQTGSLQIAGEDLRPFLRAKIGTVDAAFLVQSPTLGEIKLPPKLPVGVYDVALFDEGQELVRSSAALTVVPPPIVAVAPLLPKIEVHAVGLFVGLRPEDSRLIRAGLVFERATAPRPAPQESPIGEVLAVRSAEPVTQRVRAGAGVIVSTPVPGRVQVPAIIRVTCVMVGDVCQVDGGNVEIGSIIALPLPPLPSGTNGNGERSKTPRSQQLRFLVEEVRPLNTPPFFPVLRVAK